LVVADQDGPGVDIYHCGCFRGTRSDLVAYIKREPNHEATRTLTLQVVDLLLAAARKEAAK